MRNRSAVMVLLTAAGCLVGLGAWVYSPARPALADEATLGAVASLDRPDWKVGDTWVIETLTDRIQGRETQPATKPPRIRWQFRVRNVEKVGSDECYRIDVECLARGRVRPKTTFWCDKRTLFLRQFQTQFAFDGRYRTIRESYYCAKGQYTPVLTPINVLPLGLPAFLPPGAKGGDTFTYISQPLPAGSKDPTIIRFSHTLKQEVLPPGAKSLKQIPRAYSKSIPGQPVTEVRLTDHRQTVTQLWQKGLPWPVYVASGRTQAWLVSTGQK